MNIGSASMMRPDPMQTMTPAYQVGASGDNEAIERTPDNEQAEIAAKSSSAASTPSTGYSLAPWQGTAVNVMA
jgi:hypothetical protein